MTIEADSSLPQTARPGWRRVGPMVVVLVVTLLAIYWRTAWSIAWSWEAYKSYSHGYLIVPISLYIIWIRRHELVATIPQRQWWAAWLMVPISVGWAVSEILDVTLGLQVGLFLQLCLTCWAVLGNAPMRILWLPLAYLVLALPIWSHIVPFLQDNTASAAVTSLRIIGVPVFHEGYYIVIPEGAFVVAEVCAGLRYLLATLSIAGFYVMLNLRYLTTAAIFVAGSILVSIAFNWVRVVTVIVAGHMTEMQSPIVGDDAHIYHGWVLFGIGLVPVFLLGGWMQRKEQGWAAAAPAAVAGAPDQARGQSMQSAGPTGRHPATELAGPGLVVCCLAFAALGPVLARLVAAPPGETAAATGVDLPIVSLPPWRSIETEAWGPEFLGAHGTLQQSFAAVDGQPVSIFVAVYLEQAAGAELVGQANRLYDEERWGSATRRRVEVSDGAGGVRSLGETELIGGDSRRLVWHWYRVAGRDTASDTVAELLPLAAVVQGQPNTGAVVAVSGAYGGDIEIVRERMSRFLLSFTPVLDKLLAAALERAGA